MDCVGLKSNTIGVWGLNFSSCYVCPCITELIHCYFFFLLSYCLCAVSNHDLFSDAMHLKSTAWLCHFCVDHCYKLKVYSRMRAFLSRWISSHCFYSHICVDLCGMFQCCAIFLSPASCGRMFEHLWNIFLQHVSYVSDEKSIYNELVGVLVVALHMPSWRLKNII